MSFWPITRRVSDADPGTFGVSMSRRLAKLPLPMLTALAVALLVGWPLVELIAVALEVIGEPGSAITATPIVNTALVGFGTALITVCLGASAALLTERARIAGREWMRLGILLPVLVPPFVSALSWLRAYGPGGLLDDSTGLELPGLFGPVGIVLVISINTTPLAYLLTVAALRTRAERDLELAARVSGATPLVGTRTVTLPLLIPALLGAGALSFVVGINAFGIPAFLGTPASFDTVTTRIYQDLALSARPDSFARAILLATGLVLAALVVVSIGEAFLARTDTERRAIAIGPSHHLGKPNTSLTAAVWALIALTTVIPLVALTLVAFTRGVGLAPVPANWTLSNFAEALDGRFLGALGRSALLALLAATAAVLLGAMVAAIRNRFGRLAGVAALISFAVPGSTLAVAILLSYGTALRDTLLLILIAYVAKLWAIGHRSIAGSVGNIAPELVFAARSSGASILTAMRTVVAPLLRPALVGGWVLVFLFAFHELTMSSLLYGPGTDTLAVAILNLQQLGDVPVSSALAVILTVPLLATAIPLLVVGRLPKRLLGTG
jgi:iron(III) transport system permease protein